MQQIGSWDPLNEVVRRKKYRTPYQNAVDGIANRVRLAKELQTLFKSVREYHSWNHKWRPSPTTQIYNAHHIKIDDTQYRKNRSNFSRLYQSLRDAYIPHQDILMMVGNPYLKTIQNWDNISYSRQQVIRSEYPEIPEISREYERWDSRQNRINEGVEDFSVDILNAYMFIKTFSWKSVKWVTKSAMNLFKSRKVVQTIEKNATRIKKVADDILTEAERKGFRGIRGKIELDTPKGMVRNRDTMIGGRKYWGHALDSMQDRGVPLSAVENCIKTGKRLLAHSGRVKYYDATNKLSVVVEKKSGDVVTVIWETLKCK